MMAIGMAAKQIISDGMNVAVGGGVESISMNQTGDMFAIPDPDLLANKPELYMAMIETAEIVGERYGVSREAQDEYSAQSQARTAAAQQAGAFDDEIVPLPSVMKLQNKETGEVNEIETTLEKDEGNRPGTTAERRAQPSTRSGGRCGIARAATRPSRASKLARDRSVVAQQLRRDCRWYDGTMTFRQGCSITNFLC